MALTGRFGLVTRGKVLVAMGSLLIPPLHELGDEPAVSFGDRGLSYAELARGGRRGGRPARRRRARRRVGGARPSRPALRWWPRSRRACPWCPSTRSSAPASSSTCSPTAGPTCCSERPATRCPSSTRAPRLDTVDLDERGDERAGVEVEDEDPAFVVYTSGTTGKPKGAVLPRGPSTSNIDALAEAWEWTGDDVLAHALPLFHVHGLILGVLGPAAPRGGAAPSRPLRPGAVAASLSGGATMLFGVPTMYHRLAAEAASDDAVAAGLRPARLLVSGSAPLPSPDFPRSSG